MFVSLFIFLFVSCNSTKPIVEDNPINSLMKHDWILERLNGSELNPEDFMRGLPTLEFAENGELRGSTGCNSLMGSYVSDLQEFALNPGAMSKMKCPGESESIFLKALSSVKEFKFEGEDLVLSNEVGELLRFIPKNDRK